MKRPWKMLVLAVMSVGGLSTIAVAQTKSESLLPAHHQLSRLGLERAWWAQAILNPYRDKIRSITIDEEALIIISTSGVATALDAETGQQLWAVQMGNKDQQSYPAVTSEKQALIIYGDTLYALNKRNGRTDWSLVLPSQPSTAPSLDEKHVYIGCLDGSLYAYSMRTIRKLYEQGRLPQWSSLAQVWKFKAAKEITSPPIPSGRSVNVASRDGSLYSVTAADRKMIYQLETDKAIVAPLTRFENTMYLASEDNSFYSIKLLSGKVNWEFTSGLPIRKAPWAIDNDLFVLPDRGGMYSLDPSNGNRRWWQPHVVNYVAIMGNMVGTSDSDGNLVMISRDKGQILGQLPFRRFVVRPGNDRTDRMVLSTESGLIVSLRQAGHNFPRYHRYPDRLPLLPELEPDEATEDKPAEAKPEE